MEEKLLAGEIRVKVKAVGLNRADLLQSQGLYPPPAPEPGQRAVPEGLLGLEFSGEVVEISETVPMTETVPAPVQNSKNMSKFSVGDRVMGLISGGAMQQEIIVHEDECLALPAPLSWETGAGILECHVTAYDALVNLAVLKPGQQVWVNAAASGVGLAVLDIAKMVGASVVATSRSQSKLDQIQTWYGTSVETLCMDASSELPVHLKNRFDVIIDLVGGAHIKHDLDAVATKGTVVVLGLLAGSRAELHLSKLLSKRARLIGSVMRSRPRNEKKDLLNTIQKEVLPKLISKNMTIRVGNIFHHSELNNALEYLKDNKNKGKIVVLM